MEREACSTDFISDEKILKTIRERLTIRDEEKTLHGEVFTPPELICEMLGTLPSDVWTNKNLKWLDPANGIGNYPIIVFYKLMKGLSTAIPDEKKRSKHIIENMLYMVELNSVNVKTSNRLFRMIDPSATPNIARANFLEEEKKWKKQLGVYKFDIIMGNPPYNEGGIRAKGNVQEKGESKTLWPDFVSKSIGYLKTQDSYLLFIHPASWISLKSANGALLKSRQIETMRFYNYKHAQTLFGGSSGKIPLTYYLMKNIETKKETLVYDNCYDKFIPFNIYENNFVPTESIELMKKVYAFTKKYGSLADKYVSIRNGTDTKNIWSTTNPYPLINISYNNFEVSFSKNNNCKNNEKKLLFPNSSMGYPVLDTHGILYPNSAHHQILLSNNNENELKLLQSFFYTNLVFYMINITKTSMNFFDNKIFQILPDITKIVSETSITDTDLKKLFNLKDSETKCYDKYGQSGEGRLTKELKDTFISFDITDYMSNEQILKTKELMGNNMNGGGRFKKTRKRLPLIRRRKTRRLKRISS